MSLARHIAHLMENLVPDDIEAMPPAERRKFADRCRHWADRADQPNPNGPVRSVTFDLSQGDPRRE